MRRLNWTDDTVERARSGGHGSASGSRVVTVRTLIVAAIALVLMLPPARAEAYQAAEFTHVVVVEADGCTVRSEVTATRGNHSGQKVVWKFGKHGAIVREDEQWFTARNGETLVSRTTYDGGAYPYYVEVNVLKATRENTMVRVWGDTASGDVSCP